MAVLLVALLPAGGVVSAAKPDASRTAHLVNVRLYDSGVLPAAEITTARTEAAAILREAGIELVWLLCSDETRIQGTSAQCDMEIDPDELVVRIIQSSPQPFSNGVPLGEALVDKESHTGSLATIFADRVTSICDRAAANRPSVLGRVVAHEIGHLLLRTHNHARRGLMRAVWTDLELRRAVGLEWHFSPSEARRMRAMIVERAENGGM
jgi:hypothetical protein